VRNKEVRRRLTGFSLPVVGGGASWTTTEGAKASARRVLTFLEDRRVLFNPYWAEQAGECVASVLELRRMLTAEIGDLGDDDELMPHLQTMRAACRQFLDLVNSSTENLGHREPWVGYRRLDDQEYPLVVALGELRSAMGIQVGLVAAAFGLDVPDTLVSILPAPPDSDDGAELDTDLDRPW
jgi:hypothetical protein